MGVDLVQDASTFGQFAFAHVDLGADFVLRFTDTRYLRARSGKFGFQRLELLSRMMGIQCSEIGEQRLVTSGFARLSLQRANLPLYLFNDVADPQKICLRGFQFTQRLALLVFVFCDSGSFFKDRAAIFRTRAQDHVDLALFHHRISGARHAGVGEKTLDIAQAAGGFVEQIFGIAVAIHPTGHADVVPFNIQLICAIGKRERNLGKADRLARIGAIENDVGHFIAAERLGGLLAKHPAHSVEHI